MAGFGALINNLPMNFITFLPPASKGRGKDYFYRCLSVHTRGYPSPRLFPKSLVTCPFWRVPQSWPGGTPVPARGTRDRVPAPQPEQDLGTTLARTGLWYPLAGTGYPSPQDRTAEQTLTMQQVVCLLHSYRRTFLFILHFL